MNNASVDWGKFDSDSYAEQYTAARLEDLRVTELTRDHFAEESGHGVDVGAGTSLIPALSMLTNPNIITVDLLDYAEPNLVWLDKSCREPLAETWRPYVPDGSWSRVRSRMGSDVAVGVVDILGSDLTSSFYDLATMFYVAESISTDPREFETACQRFLACLRSDSPYVCTFSHMNTHYFVNGVEFPAVPVGVDEVAEVFAPLSGSDFHVEHIQIDPPLYPEWTGVVYAQGRTR